LDIFVTLSLSGLVLGSIYAIGALGLVIGYKASRLLNFGHVAVATVSPYLFMEVFRPPLGLWGGLVVTVLFGAFLGTAIYWLVVRPLKDRAVMAVVATLGCLIVSVELVGVLWGTELRPIVAFLPQGTFFTFGGFAWGKDLAVLCLTVAVLGVGADLAFRRTPIGIRIEALAQDRFAAGTCGVDERRYTALSWGAGGALAAGSGVLVAPFLGLQPTVAVTIFVPTAAAALIAGLSSLRLALFGGLLVGVLESLATWISSTAGYSQAVGLAVIIGVLLVRGRSLGWRDRDGIHTSEGFVRTSRGLRPVVRRAPLVVGLGGLAFVSIELSGYWVFVATLAASWTLAVASVIFLRRVGQISLGQAAFMGVGAFAAAGLWEVWRVPFPVALAGAVALSGLVGVAFALPALRIRGLNLTLVTLAAGVFFSDRVFRWYWFSGGEQGGRSLGRPWSFGENVAFMWFAWGVVGCALLLAENVARGKTGRIFRTIQESEVACAAAGVSVSRYKTLAFGISAMLAGTGGVLMGSLQGHVGQDAFGFLGSMTVLIGGVIAGSASMWAAVVGGVLITATPELLKIVWKPEYSQLILGCLLLVGAARLPEGLFGLWVGVAKRVSVRSGSSLAGRAVSEGFKELELTTKEGSSA
jgi:ABC-type branched-subunit amino acid transport system permease subunit